MIYLMPFFKIKKQKYNTRYETFNFSTDFLLFISIIIEIVENINKKEIIKKYISILNIICVKYIVLFKESFLTSLEFCNICGTYMFVFLDILLNEEIEINYKEEKEVYQRILICKKVSRTREKGRIVRYKIVVLLYKKEDWFGIGEAKDFYLQTTLSKARLCALKNKYSISLKFSNLPKKNYIYNKGNHILYFRRRKQSNLVPSLFFLRSTLESFKNINISAKKMGVTNISKFIKIMLR